MSFPGEKPRTADTCILVIEHTHIETRILDYLDCFVETTDTKAATVAPAHASTIRVPHQRIRDLLVQPRLAAGIAKRVAETMKNFPAILDPEITTEELHECLGES